MVGNNGENVTEDGAEAEQPAAPLDKSPPLPAETNPVSTTGLVPKEASKLPISEAEIDITQLSVVIGPKYILNALVPEDKLLKTPSHPLLFHANHPLEEGGEEIDKIADERINQGIVSHESLRILRDRRSRFYGRGKITRTKRRGASDCLRGAQRKRGLLSNSNLFAFFCKALPKKWRPMHLDLPMIGNPFVYQGKPKIGFYYDSNRSPLPNIGKLTHTNFRILNTVKKLDDVNPHGGTTILLQWSRGGTPKVRNIRVDGVSEERTYIEEAAFFLDSNLGKARTLVYERRIGILLLLLGISLAIFAAIAG